MDLLPLHIEYLLTRHDCVIVPGIGAFIATEKEAAIDFERGIITPRRREISFNGNVVTDDGLLSHSIARREKISYEEAHRLLNSLTEKMKSDLEHEGEVSVNMIGKLLKDEEGFINFEPRNSSIASDILPDAEIRVKEQPASEVLEKTASKFASELMEDASDPDGMRIIRVSADRYVFTVSKRAVHAAAMLITLFTVCLSLMIPINHDGEQKASVVSIDDFFHHIMVSEESRDKMQDKPSEVTVDSIAAVQLEAGVENR